ncbi:hypothetical protein BCR33DRAFT_787053 [Rhizoclosmatium globosum]|uniref:Uncharacterized protein n=1 Tax=Rhizoclosmatium globosum TaxID=329046 RepID=A0A1Y2C2T6_9FUNG|nr:hypothetical protein BCR33DRAFT_787053 [Rhizoclosmatium globosum]|eukprot:ORY41311.1 hypothetical protein BCR33DRAFT_787053 [Rhizoclosmatium globosum]
MFTIRLCIFVASIAFATALSANISPSTKPQLHQFAGPIIRNVEVNPIFFGSLASLPRRNCSSFMRPCGSIGRAYSLPAGTCSDPVTSLDDRKDIKPLLYKLVKDGVITPDFNFNSVYAFHVAPGINVTSDFGDKSCKSMSGYHSYVNITDLNVPNVPFLIYTVIPDPACMVEPPFSYSDLLQIAASHELAEAVTDPLLSLAIEIMLVKGAKGVAQATQVAAWVDVDTLKLKVNGEIADFCEGQADLAPVPKTVGGDGKEYSITKFWSQKKNACVVA